MNHCKVGVAVKRALAGQQLVEHHASSKQVGPRVNRAAFQLLRRHVFEGADNRALRARGVARVLNTRNAKIGQLDSPIGLHQQIGGLDVAVHNFLLVCVAQRRQQVGHDAKRLRQGVDLALVQVMLQVVTFNELQHQKSNVAVAV